jgi:hypothetical protein
MASKDKNTGQNLNIESAVFNKGMMMDFDDLIVPEGVWIRARNAVNNSQNGNIGVIGNEPSNQLCQAINYTVIGLIYISDGVWAVFSTDDQNHQIGIYREDSCSYTAIHTELVGRKGCLNFRRTNLIKGVARERFDCTRQLYWDDGFNPSRTIALRQDLTRFTDDYYVRTITNQQTGEDPDEDCEISTYDYTTLNCENLRLNPLFNPPCVKLKRASYSGTLLNGTYQVAIAYAIDGQKVTDYVALSNPQSLYKHENSNSSLEVVIESIDERFEQFELVVISFYNGQTQAKKMGVYSTQTGSIFIDIISNELEAVPTSLIPLISTVYEKSEGMYRNGDYLLRVAPTSYFDFNYQPLANLIETEWYAAAYPEDYYYKGGNKTTYLRDEVYSFFIRWVYNTGQKSPSFHIPGRAKNSNDSQILSGVGLSTVTNNPDEIDNQKWRYVNTATRTFPAPPNPINYNVGFDNTDDGGIIVAKGEMGYWESTEEYSNFRPDIWNSSAHTWTGVNGASPEYDLCGQRIRHHKFPDMDVIPHFTADYDINGDLVPAYQPANLEIFPGVNVTINPETFFMANCQEDAVPNVYRISTGKNYKIILLGVNFNNIKPPVDNNGDPIPGIIGYEILRGNRLGNKTILAKGIFNTLREYDLPEYALNPNSIYRRKGLFYNYPFNDQRSDTLLSKIKVDGGCKPSCDFNEYPALNIISTDFLGFDSPETEFFNSFLDVDEFKINCTYVGSAEGKFTEVKDHPKHALPNDLALIISAIFGIITAANTTILSGFLTGTPEFSTQVGSNITATDKKPPIDSLPAGVDEVVSVFMKPIAFMYYTIQITQGYLDAILALLGTRQYALQHKAYCFYSSIAGTYGTSGKLFKIKDSRYIGPTRAEIDEKYIINNLYRNNFTLIQTNGGIPNVNPSHSDTSRYSIHKAHLFPITNTNIRKSDGITYDDPVNKIVNTRSSTLYGSLKFKIRNIYGQLNQIRQIPISNCLHPAPAINSTTSTSYTIFGGDNYVGRYTKKNTFFFFYDWLNKQPDEFEYDYRKYVMIPYPRYWINTQKYSTSQLVNNLFPGIICKDYEDSGILNNGNEGTFEDLLEDATYEERFPSDNASLTRDQALCYTGGDIKEILCGNGDVLLRIDGWFYLFYSGVKDFFVESEINLAQRDYDDKIETKHYDKYNSIVDYNDMFNSDIIKERNFYKYDQALSVDRFYNIYTTFGVLQPVWYDPQVAETCYTYSPKRVIYSLPGTKETIKDYWRYFLANNFKEFGSRITSISPISKNGTMIHFKDISPVQFVGVDTLQTDLGTKITVGDGGLFNQPLQNIVNTDSPYEYGSCQDRLSIINTPFGIFWISQEQGKIFNYGGQLAEISASGMRWWFANNLPYQLTKFYPDFELRDNPVIGVGCQAIYDNKNQIIYFTKKDYIPRDTSLITYVSGNIFRKVGTNQEIELGNKLYFEEASWTISYDPKLKIWVSFHDWHPQLMIPERNTFVTIKNKGFWKHNNTCTSFCNFYGTNYPFEIETALSTGQSVTTLRNVEYMLESYRYTDNCLDNHHLLDHNFDNMIVYNSEQISGVLNLVPHPKNDPITMISYPRINPNSIDVLFSKEENKYRVNQFWDITTDRGEFSGNTNILWETAANGYAKAIRSGSVNYAKSPLERKKFRHYATRVVLIKNISNNIKMFYKVFNLKQAQSYR